MADWSAWSDYHSGQQVDVLAKVGGSIPITVLWLDIISIQNTAMGFP